MIEVDDIRNEPELGATDRPLIKHHDKDRVVKEATRRYGSHFKIGFLGSDIGWVAVCLSPDLDGVNETLGRKQ